MNTKQTTTVSLDIEQIEKLNDISRRTKIPRSVLIREAVDRVLDQYKTQLELLEKVEEKGR